MANLNLLNASYSNLFFSRSIRQTVRFSESNKKYLFLISIFYDLSNNVYVSGIALNAQIYGFCTNSTPENPHNIFVEDNEVEKCKISHFQLILIHFSKLHKTNNHILFNCLSYV